MNLERHAQDLLNHFDRRLEAMDGKAMIVCVSRRICLNLYNAIVRLRPERHDGDLVGKPFADFHH